MSATFEELDRRSTPLGEISLRRRVDPTLGTQVYEVKLGDEFLMSSLFTVAETALATLSLATLETSDIDVLVGGLGLGYTARAALQDTRVSSLHVIEALSEVIGWHERELLPLRPELVSDPRCHLVLGDFFNLVAHARAVSAAAPRRFHAVLVDIDHSPTRWLHPSHADFYRRAGLVGVVHLLHPGGVFGLWSDDPPDRAFVALLESVFSGRCEAHVVEFPNPFTGDTAANTVYVARCLE